MTKVLFKRKTSDEIANLPVEDGALIYNHETGATYLDYGNERIPTGGGMPTGDTFPIGAITSYAGNTAPVNWLICDGRAISRTTYADLFDAIGTTYGVGDGSTTFNLPNLKGRVITGLDSTQTEFDTLGETGGEKTHTLTIDEMPSHNHGMNAFSDGGNTGRYNATITWNTASLSEGNRWIGDTVATGGGQAHNILQPYITLNYIIKAFQSSGTVANVSMTEINSDTDTYSCNYINGIVESGSNTNGNYIKFIDGTMICYKTVSGTYSCNQKDGSVYKTLDIDLGDYAQTFTQLPTISASAGGTSFCWLGLVGGSSQSVSSPGIAILLRPTSSSLAAKINIIAIGRWK